MSNYRNRKTPGVYLSELDAFPPSIVGVQTAVPAFIGYTEKAKLNGKTVLNRPIKISSLVDYQEIFGGAHRKSYDVTDVPMSTTKDNEVKVPPNTGTYDLRFEKWELKDDAPTKTAAVYYRIASSSSSFYLYDSMRLFFANGGGNCYVVSVGVYEKADGSANSVTWYDETNKVGLKAGLDAIHDEVGPTMLVVPDGSQLSTSAGGDFSKLAKQMLGQSMELRDRMAILDVPNADEVGAYIPPASAGGDAPAPYTLYGDKGVIDQFRQAVGEDGLNYGAAYFPFLQTTVKSADEVDLRCLSQAGQAAVKNILDWQNMALNYDKSAEGGGQRYKDIAKEIKKIGTQGVDQDKLTCTLAQLLPALSQINGEILAKDSVLPASGAMAGIFTNNDNTRGVWNAPANLVVSSVSGLTYNVKDNEQDDLNVPINGKAIDVIREFVGRGPVVWGARTLDGNSPDYRYIQVRRTLIYIEQSIKRALDPFVFAANDGKTWSTVVSMISGFLNGLWSQGGLMGSKPDEAFSVACGLGSTMTSQDVLNGYMIVQVTLQMIRPAEFIELTFTQKMEGVS